MILVTLHTIFDKDGPREGSDIDFIAYMSVPLDLLREGFFGEGLPLEPQILQDIMDGKYDDPNVRHLKDMRKANMELMKIATFYDSESLSDLLINEIGFSKVLFKSDNPYNKQAYFVGVRK